MNECQQLAITQFGQPSVLVMQTVEVPQLSDGEVLVKVAYAGVNPIDVKTRAGLGWAAQQNKENLPWVPGYDISGEVVAVGAGVASLELGDAVSGFVGFPLQGGGYSEYMVADADALSRVDTDNVSLIEAAALPLAGQTAWQSLNKAKVSVGDQVLILAGAGGVGHIAIQLAVARGATVVASCSADNVDFVSKLGAIALDYRLAPLNEQIAKVDVLIDLMGGDVGMAALECVKSGGRVVTVPTITADAVCERARELGLEAEGMLVSPSLEQNNAMMAMLKAGTLQLYIAAQYRLCDGAQAHQQIESGHTRGKIVLSVGV
ncbi:NADP-dependent oxidoreductase [uncultured Photobacterium sp.]|uniref:NADP-dependent oxidoreductase n=1 Tax=uncultured Photobacterium sp. TaxID=173973 RepID=UPI002635F13E|nr:NADP-dependent oxidoreductase [uncultured Photobacterium sp.]